MSGPLLGPISSSPFLITPIARQGKAVEPINNIALGSLQIGHGKVAVVEMDNLINRENPFEMACHLVWTKMGAISKNSEEMPFPGMRRFRFTAADGAKMPREVGDVVDARQYVQEVPLRNPFSKGLF